MTQLFKKLNLKDRTEIVVLNAPRGFERETAALEGVDVRTSLEGVERTGFALVFASKQVEVDEHAARLAPLLAGDAVLWFAYPKGSSKRYTCDFNRDTGWAALGRLGFEPVRQVAIDEEWSALRFRRVEHIRSMKRDASRALSEEGRKRVR